MILLFAASGILVACTARRLGYVPIEAYGSSCTEPNSTETRKAARSAIAYLEKNLPQFVFDDKTIIVCDEGQYYAVLYWWPIGLERNTATVYVAKGSYTVLRVVGDQ